MADSTIQLPADGAGKILDTEELTVGLNSVHRERIQIAGSAALEIARILNDDPAGTDYALVTREVGPIDPQTSTDNVAVVGAGSTGSVDSTQISSGTTGKLLAFVAASSVPFKADVQTLLNGVATTRLVLFGRGDNLTWTTPHKEFITQIHDVAAGFDGFRITFTNLDTGSGSADFYATFLWDET